MRQPPSACPPDLEEIAEAYCMETLARDARLAFEDHCRSCARCASEAARTNEFIRAMKTALHRQRPPADASRARKSKGARA